MNPFSLLSALLGYPTDELRLAATELREHATQSPDLLKRLTPLLELLESSEAIELQENYVDTFDRNPSHSLHLFEHVHGESRDRGQAMVDLLEEYRRQGFDLCDDELPDYLPVFFEFLGQLPESEAVRLLNDAVHVIAHIAGALERNESPYAGVLRAAQDLCTVEVQPLMVAPIRDMDEAMEKFGCGPDGSEPLLGAVAPKVQEQQVKFYGRRN